MKLAEWAGKQPYRVQESASWMVIPDSSNLVDRSEAWHLEDYRVTYVTGGSIWFSPREENCEHCEDHESGGSS